MSSSERFSALKGMRDILPPDIYVWQRIEETAKEVFSSFGFQELRTPIAEPTGIFTRSIGESTDIVEKEMYTFQDKAGRSVSLRPEGTASVVRCYVENHLYNNPPPQKFYYSGPMFRYERPQSGRFRQFFQIGVEAFGSARPETDAEVISMLRHFLERLGLGNLRFHVNSIGCEKCRPDYRKALLDFFLDKREDLCNDCKRRYELNPLRILDCKVDKCIEARKGAPKITDYLCPECREHFDMLRSLLGGLGVPHAINPEMVRGLDYYTRTTFEVTSENLGAQNAVAAGGRYDRLVREFDGPETPAIGFAVGTDRLVELLKAGSPPVAPSPEMFVANLGPRAGQESILIADRLRAEGLWVEIGDNGASLKSQMRRADRLSAKRVLIIGEEEMESGVAKWKDLRTSAAGEVPLSDVNALFVKN